MAADMDKPNYTKEAFKNPYNLISLAGAGLFGLLNPEFLPILTPIVGALEGIYLLTVPSSGWFKRLANISWQRHLKLEKERYKERLVLYLNDSDRKIYNELKSIKIEIIDHCQKRDQANQLLLDELIKLDLLLESYLKLAYVRAECQRHLYQTDLQQIEENLRRLERELPSTPEKARPSKQQTIEILKRRRQRLSQIREYIEVIKAQLEAIENSFKLINDQVIALGFTAEEEVNVIATEINKIIQNVGETEEAVKKVSVDVASVQKVLGELTGITVDTALDSN